MYSSVLLSLGGPEAYLGVFYERLVAKKNYLSEKALMEWMALCSFLPGPTSTQVITGIGLNGVAESLALLPADLGNSCHSSNDRPFLMPSVPFRKWTIPVFDFGTDGSWLCRLGSLETGTVLLTADHSFMGSSHYAHTSSFSLGNPQSFCLADCLDN